MTNQERTLLTDARLSREARLMGLYLASRGEQVEVSTEDWQRILGSSHQGGFPTRRTLAHYAAELTTWGYVEKKPGGSGSPRYEFLQGSQDPVEALQGSGSPVEQNSYRAPRATEDHSTGLREPGRGASSSSRVVVVDDVEERADTGEPRYSLEPKVTDAIEGAEDLIGCRGALRDYLRRRVMGPQQWGYVQTVRTWLAGGIGAPKGLHDAPPEDRTHLFAAALNELASESVATEQAYRAARGKVGQTATLRSKVEYLVRREKSSARNGSDSTPPDTPTHARRTPFPEDQEADNAA